MVSSRQSTTPRYSGVTSTSQRTASGYAVTGKNVAENRNSGSWARVILSKSCQDFMYVVSPMQTAANAKPISIAAGRASTAHHECSMPIRPMTTRNAAEYVPPRSCPQAISPRAMSLVDSGVASIWS